MQAKAKASPKKAGTTGAGSVTTKDQRKRQGKKRSVAEAVDEVNGTAEDPPKRQKNVENGATKADLQVCAGSAVQPLLQTETQLKQVPQGHWQSGCGTYKAVV